LPWAYSVNAVAPFAAWRPLWGPQGALTPLVDFALASSARQAVARQIEKWAEKTGLTVKAPTNIADVVIHSEIRAHIANMKSGKVDFLAKHGTDPVFASAILCAPGFLSGLTEDELTFVRRKVEQHIAPQIAEARDATLKAMKEAEQGWRKAVEKIGERGGLTEDSLSKVPNKCFAKSHSGAIPAARVA
jgi:hypothetical protein